MIIFVWPTNDVLSIQMALGRKKKTHKKQGSLPSSKTTNYPATENEYMNSHMFFQWKATQQQKKNWITYVFYGRNETGISETLLKESSQKRQQQSENWQNQSVLNEIRTLVAFRVEGID